MEAQKKALVEQAAMMTAVHDNVEALYRDVGYLMAWKYSMVQSEGRVVVRGSRENPIEVSDDEEEEEEYRVCYEQS